MSPVATPPPPRPQHVWLRRLPFLMIMAAAILGAFTLRDTFSIETLARHREALLAFRDGHYFWTVVAFIAAYVAVVALSLPGGTVSTLIGGFLFGLFPGVFYNVLAAGTGAVLIFLAARAGFGESLAQRIADGGGKAARLQAALRENEWSVLLVMRLVPAVPFFLANLIPAFVGIRFSRYAITTYVGIIPGALVFTGIGAGLGEVFASGGVPDLGVVLSPPILLPLLGLAVLASLPMILKAAKGGPRHGADQD